MVVTTEQSPQGVWNLMGGMWGQEVLQEAVMLPEELSRGRSKALALQAEKTVGKAAELPKGRDYANIVHHCTPESRTEPGM